MSAASAAPGPRPAGVTFYESLRADFTDATLCDCISRLRDHIDDPTSDVRNTLSLLHTRCLLLERREAEAADSDDLELKLERARLTNAFLTTLDDLERYHASAEQETPELTNRLITPSWESGMRMFMAYAPTDRDFAERIRHQMRLMTSRGTASIWSPDDAPRGGDKPRLTRAYIQTADVMLLLLSPDLLKSAFYREYGTLLAALHREQQVQVLPLYVRPCEYEGHFFESVRIYPEGNRAMVELSVPEAHAAYAELSHVLFDRI